MPQPAKQERFYDSSADLFEITKQCFLLVFFASSSEAAVVACCTRQRFALLFKKTHTLKSMNSKQY